MVCSRCQKTVPDESTFCLACGARLVTGERLAPPNGKQALAGLVPAATPAEGADKQPYALSLGPIVDERLRYRVARWVVERAPAHALAEVQNGLTQGQFLTFLALTAAEAEAVREGMWGLGVAPPLLSLVPAASTAAFLPSARARPRAGGARGIQPRTWLAIGLGAAGLVIASLVLLRLVGGHGF